MVLAAGGDRGCENDNGPGRLHISSDAFVFNTSGGLTGPKCCQAWFCSFCAAGIWSIADNDRNMGS